MSILAFKDFLKEVAANAVGGGGVEGIGYPPKSAKGEPGIHVRKKKKFCMKIGANWKKRPSIKVARSS